MEEILIAHRVSEVEDDEHIEQDVLFQRLKNQEDRPRCCWCCRPCCLCDVCGEHPIGIRALDAISQCIFWSAGMYGDGEHFNRGCWEMIEWINSNSPVPKKRPYKGCYSYDVKISNADGDPMTCRIYSQVEPKSSNQPVFLFFHGGGFTCGHPSTKNHDELCHNFARDGFCVVSVDYRLAPEYPHPYGVRDAYESLRWVKSKEARDVLPPHCDSLTLVIGGDSAGGNIALITATLARDRLTADLIPLRPDEPTMSISHIVLIYPGLFFIPATDSLQDMKQGYFISEPVVKFFMRSYLPGTPEELKLLLQDRRVAPFKAGVHGLPPVSLVSASDDPLRDEVVLLADLLQEVGVPVSHHHFKGVHGFATFWFLKNAKICQTKVSEDMKHLHTSPSVQDISRS